MSVINLQQNLENILIALEDKGMKRTNIAKEIGYTTTTQLNSTLSGKSMLSTKAIVGLIENLQVNPTYLFFGEGDMFLKEDSEIKRLQKEYSELHQKYTGTQDELWKCKEQLEKAVYRYNKLIDITSIALDKTQNTDENKDKD